MKQNDMNVKRQIKMNYNFWLKKQRTIQTKKKTKWAKNCVNESVTKCVVNEKKMSIEIKKLIKMN